METEYRVHGWEGEEAKFEKETRMVGSGQQNLLLPLVVLH